ncbi:MAG TPA: hypothetical protein VFJ71_08775 [Candidatus Limnocylindrales bacterium]|nr:hypothetical protein [Candidatus Limnocylindrales bacterium]
MLRSASGAQRASTHTAAGSAARRRLTRAALSIAGMTIAAAIAAPSVSAATTPVASGPDGTVQLTTTTIDRPYLSVEKYYLGLVNCTRTGGWVLSDGTCRGYGSGHYSAYRSPLTFNWGISDKVSRPYAKLLAVKALCTHTADGDPGYRLRRAGYTRWTWGENIGCRDGYSTAKAAVLASHLYFQSEKSTNGGHWRNIKNANYHWIGIGVWRYGTRTRLVTDFYG